MDKYNLKEIYWYYTKDGQVMEPFVILNGGQGDKYLDNHVYTIMFLNGEVEISFEVPIPLSNKNVFILAKNDIDKYFSIDGELTSINKTADMILNHTRLSNVKGGSFIGFNIIEGFKKLYNDDMSRDPKDFINYVYEYCDKKKVSYRQIRPLEKQLSDSIAENYRKIKAISNDSEIEL